MLVESEFSVDEWIVRAHAALGPPRRCEPTAHGVLDWAR
jgi:hypothetical protein